MKGPVQRKESQASDGLKMSPRNVEITHELLANLEIIPPNSSLRRWNSKKDSNEEFTPAKGHKRVSFDKNLPPDRIKAKLIPRRSGTFCLVASKKL
uniref:Uncharacterized protein n=1 Tax=Heterorhabditis bacteriophora TaxID=37862 RepID=A0A1I7W7E6_HETBA